MSTYNHGIIEEFRSNGGKVGGPFEDMSLLLLTTRGRRTGQPRTSPVAYTSDGSRYVIAASKAGADDDPLWYLNLEADPRATVEVGDRTLTVRAEVQTGAERDRLYAAHAERMPGFAEYEKKTTRTIPVVTLEPVDAPGA